MYAYLTRIAGKTAFALVLVLLAAGATAAAPKTAYDIPPQSLQSALLLYQEQSGLNLAYPDNLVKGKTSPGVNGEAADMEALSQLLRGTGLAYARTGQGGIVLREALAGTTAGSPGAAPDVRQDKVRKENALKLDNIVVTATKTEMKTHEVPAAVNVVTDEDIKLTPGADNYYDAIRNVPGVAVRKEGFQDTVLIRGKESSILINGRDMNPFITNTSLITGSMNVGMGAVERIEVIKGPQAAIHGSKAVSGVVNVIHKRGDKDNPFAELHGFYGTGDELSGGLNLGGGYENLSWFLDFSAAEQDEYKTPKGKIPYMDYKRKNLYVRLDYAFSDDHELYLDYTYNRSKNTLGGDGYHYTKSEWNQIYSHEPEYQGAFLTYNGKFSDIFSLYATAGIGKNDYEMIYSSPNYEPQHFLNKENETFFKEDIFQGEVRGTVNFLSDERLRGIFGVQYKNTDIDGSSDLTSNGIKERFFAWDERERYWAPYAQLEFKPIPYLLLVGGVRYDDYDSSGKKMTATNPNVGLSIFPFAGTDYDWSTIWCSYSEAFKTPTASERYLPGFLGGNPDLDPEKSQGWEIGLKQRIATWANFEMSYFQTDYENLIRLVTLGPMEWKFLNVDEAEYKGYELAAEIYPADWLTLHFSLTDLDREDKDTGKKLLGQPNQMFQYGVTLNDLYGFSFSLWGRQNEDFKVKSGGKKVAHPSEGDIIWDAKLLYRWDLTENSVFEPFISVENIGDEEYYAYPPDMGIMEGRTWHVGANLRVNF